MLTGSDANSTVPLACPFTEAGRIKMSNERTDECHCAATKFVVKGLHRFATVEAPDFREDRSRLRQEVQDLHTSVKEERWFSGELKKELDKVQGDLKQNDGQMSSEDSVLEMKLKGSETVARLAAEIVDIKSRYDKEKSLREAADQKTELLQQENEKLQTELQATDEQVATLRRKVDDTTAAMQELGRENQSLRVSEPQSLPFQRRAASYLLRLVLTIKQSQSLARKWAEDHEVRNCMTCHKGFSVTVRKHHCRQCGKIFCAECSSRKALMPFSTKPVRVCETCFEELQG
ncbi:uncharacterized protein ACBT44_004555 isoform 2-T4 [Syngnathus typhle]